MNTVEIRQKRAGLVAEARAIVDAGDMNAEAEARYDALMTEVTKLGDQIQRAERVQSLEAELATSQGAFKPETSERGGVPKFESRGLQGLDAGTFQQPEWRQLEKTTKPEYRSAFRSWMGLRENRAEMRALQADLDVSGGYLVAPMQFVDTLIKAVDNMVFMRGLATQFSVPNAESLGAPSLDADPADPAWTAELAIGTEDSSMTFGRRELHPHPLAKYIKISRKLIQKVPGVENLVAQRLGYKFAVTLENAYLNGNGAGQALGVFTASALGISTGRDVSTGNTTTNIQFDGLLEAKYTLKGQYWPKARWIFHRDGVKKIAKLKDGDGQYIWRPDVRSGEPDVLLGVPVLMSEYAPNTFTTSLYVGIIGDFSNYWIADSMQLEFQRLVELYAATNQVGWIGRIETDGMPVLEEAFVRVKLA